jgi:ADP-ribose pyrophosphatase YjhB (NUDIX family)
LEVTALSVVEVFERIMRDAKGAPEYHYVLVDYLCKATGGELKAAGDARRAEWVKRTDLPRIKMTEGTLGVIERAFDQRAARKSK